VFVKTDIPSLTASPAYSSFSSAYPSPSPTPQFGAMNNPLSPTSSFSSLEYPSSLSNSISDTTVSEILKDYFDPGLDISAFNYQTMRKQLSPPSIESNPISPLGIDFSPSSSSPPLMLSSTLSMQTTIAAFLDDGFSMPAYSMNSTPSTSLGPPSLFYPSIPSPSVSLSLSGAAPSTLCASDLFYALDFLNPSNNGLIRNMRGVLSPHAPIAPFPGSQGSFYRAAVGDHTRVHSEIKAGGDVRESAIARAQKLAGGVKKESVPSAEPSLDDQLRVVCKDVEERVIEYVEKLSVGCRGRFTRERIEIAARGIVEYQIVIGIVDLLVAGYSGKKVDTKTMVTPDSAMGGQPIESLLGLTQDMSALALASSDSEEGQTYLSASGEKAELADTSKNSARSTGIKKGGKGALLPGSYIESTHMQLNRWWTGTQDLATLKSIFTETSSSPLDTLDHLLRVYAESASWKTDYNVELMSEALGFVVGDGIVSDSTCILKSLRGMKRRLEDGIPLVFEGLVRVMVGKGIVKAGDWERLCVGMGMEMEFVDEDGSYAKGVDVLRRPIAVLCVGEDRYSW
jgi:hypothetical protein